MSYCRKCGALIDDEAVICPKCGVPTDLYKIEVEAISKSPIIFHNSKEESEYMKENDKGLFTGLRVIGGIGGAAGGAFGTMAVLNINRPDILLVAWIILVLGSIPGIIFGGVLRSKGYKRNGTTMLVSYSLFPIVMILIYFMLVAMKVIR